MRFEGDLITVDPVLNAMTRTLRVRIAVPNGEKALKPEMFVDVVLEVPLGTKLSIPEEAVLDTGERQLVFVDKGEGRIEPREVRVGYEGEGYYEVLSGLAKGEKVVSSANFLIDSESRLRAAVKGFTGGEKREEGHRH
jgi:Cu(I)/Ag(I) efflux system membrane fusion protein